MPIVFNIFGTMNTAKTGMFSQQAGLSVTGHNVSNVSTEGFSRRRLVTSSVGGPPTGGGGVSIDGIHRYTDIFATQRLVQEETLKGSADRRSTVLSHVAELFNDLEGTALGDRLDAFFGAVRQLQSSPSETTVRQEMLARGDELAAAFNRISSELTNVRVNMDNILKSSAAEVNIRTEKIAQINADITKQHLADGDVSDMLDQREQLIREVAEHVQVHYITNDKNQVTLFLEGGIPLVEGIRHSTLRVQDTAAPGASEIEYITPSGQVSVITDKIEGGAMGGTLNVRDQLVPQFASDVDQLAYDFVTTFNAQHAAGFGLDGAGGRDFFAPLASATNAAALIRLDAAVDGSPEAVAAAQDPALLPGDNRNALELAALADGLNAAGGTMTYNESYATIVGEVGVEARRAADEISLRQTSIKHIEDLKDSAVGVSLDEEMTNLIQYQRAYQASARVLNTVDSIIQTILGLGAGG